MNYNEALEYIHSLLRFGSRPGLERIRELLSALGNPQDQLKFLHIAGTNGKGSVCTMLSRCLIEAGYKTGLYISPYITCFRERIQINGEYISESDLASLTEKVKNTGIEVTEFEFITAVAFLYFKAKGCDVVVLETGLGGRLDATNVIKPPLAAVITGIGFDHTAVLGETLSEIAGEKCGIIKEDCRVFTTYNQPPEAASVINSHKNVVAPDLLKLSGIKSDLSGNTFIYKGIEYNVSLIGRHQIENALLVIETLHGCSLSVSDEDIKKGLASVSFPARLEILSREPLVILDGAHNPHGARALSNEMRKFQGITLITGMMADKDCEEVVSIIAPLCEKIVTVTVEENPRSITAVDLAEIAKKYCPSVTAAENYSHALDLCENDKTIFVSGSLYLAGGIRELIKERLS